MDVRGKRVLILGLAREGASLARFLARQGADVVVTDVAPPHRLQGRTCSAAKAGNGGPAYGRRGRPSVRFVLGGHHPELVSGTELFFVSPGVPETNPVYRAADQAGLRIQSMTTLFFDLCPGPIVGITGSSGKTTTTALIGHIARTAGRDVVVGGNIGEPMLDLLPNVSAETLVVVELSSFQLQLLRRSPWIAVVTNISPNHLDRHPTIADYVTAKRHIVEHQQPGDHAVLNAADCDAAAFARATPAEIHHFGLDGNFQRGATARQGQASLAREGELIPVLPVDDIPLLGRHNVENVLAALAATDLLKIAPEAMAEAVRTFRPAPHRLQTVRDRAGVRYIDDSIATSPARAIVALQALDAPVLLIAGGRDKQLPWEEFAALVGRKARAVFLIGEAAPVIERAVRPHLSHGLLRADAVRHCSSLQEAVMAASRLAVPGDVVLLSPGCTSYDMFADFEERGMVFVRAVEALDAA